MDEIRIEGLKLDCIVGLRPHERRREQAVCIDLTLALDFSRAEQTGRISDTVDYARVTDEVAVLLRYRAYRLIEVATAEIATMLLAVHPALESALVRLEKPEALQGRARSASVCVQRSRTQLAKQLKRYEYGEHELVLENHEARLELFHVLPGRRVELEGDATTRRLEWMVQGELESGAGERLSHLPHVAPANSGSIVNRSRESAVLFSCSYQNAELPGNDAKPDS